MVRLNRFDIFDVEISQAVRLQIERNEHCHVIKTVADVGDRVAGSLVDMLIVPNVGVQLKQTRFRLREARLTAMEKVVLANAALFTVSLVNVDGQQGRAGCNHTRVII